MTAKLQDHEYIKRPPTPHIYKHQTWQNQAECFDLPTTIFFPNGNLPETNYEVKTAINICHECPVIQQCAQYVLDLRGTYCDIRSGIWAGIRFPDSGSDTKTITKLIAEADKKLEAIANPHHYRGASWQ